MQTALFGIVELTVPKSAKEHVWVGRVGWRETRHPVCGDRNSTAGNSCGPIAGSACGLEFVQKALRDCLDRGRSQA